MSLSAEELERKRKRIADAEEEEEDEEEEEEEEEAFSKAVASAVQAACMPFLDGSFASVYCGREPGSLTIKRVRKDLNLYFQELGPTVFRRMYRMHEEDFYKLHDILEPRLPPLPAKGRGDAPNGRISNLHRLAMALRFMAGGERFDIAGVHGVHPCEVYKSLWLIVDAINNTTALDIVFPSSHDEQREMARQFADKSKCGFNNCVAAKDGMLVWTNKPSEKMDDMGIGNGKFFSGRKSKFGLNMQAICDANRRFVDVYVGHPGSASDYTMWLESPVRQLIEKTPGFLCPGLVFYGDNAYVNTMTTVAPFKAVSSGPKDAFNFYHSQLRITIEGAFGSLVHRWGCLRKPMPVGFKISKISRLVVALCKLHNFCIDCKHGDTSMSTPMELFYISSEGGLAVPSSENRVDALLDSGDFTEDVGHFNRKRSRANTAPSLDELPIYAMLRHIEDHGYKRPPANIRSRN